MSAAAEASDEGGARNGGFSGEVVFVVVHVLLFSLLRTVEATVVCSPVFFYGSVATVSTTASQGTTSIVFLVVGVGQTTVVVNGRKRIRRTAPPRGVRIAL